MIIKNVQLYICATMQVTECTKGMRKSSPLYAEDGK